MPKYVKIVWAYGPLLILTVLWFPFILLLAVGELVDKLERRYIWNIFNALHTRRRRILKGP